MKFNYHKSTLENGVRVLTIPLESTAAVTSLIFVGTGSHYEVKEQNGISHFLEHLFFKGSEKYKSAKEVATTLDEIGASYNAFTSDEVTGFYVKTVKDKIEQGVDVMADYLKNPLFPEKEIERERGVILEEIRMYNDDPQEYVMDLFQTNMYGDQPAGWYVGGSEESVKDITPSQVREYFEKQYKGENIVAVFAGNITQKEAEDLAEQRLSELPEGSGYKKDPVTPPKKDEDIVNIHKKDTDQSHIVLGFEGFPMDDERAFTVDVLTTLMGGGMSSRLFQEIRAKRGLAYYVGASGDEGTDFGYIFSRAGVTNDKVEEAVDVLIKEFAKIKENSVEDDELTKAKNIIEGHMLLGLETSSAVARAFGEQEILLDEVKYPPSEYLDKIKNVTAKDVQEVANEVIKKEKTRLTLISKYEHREKLEDIVEKGL